MTQFLLAGTLSPNRTVARACHALAAALSARFDPVVRYRLNGRTLALPLSHDLPWNRRMVPTYSDNLRRLAAFVRARAGSLRLVDVGANVGDSWCLAGHEPHDAALLVEGSPRWFALLERNTAAEPAVTRVHALVSDRSDRVAGGIVAERGNARIVPGHEVGARTLTLDDIVAAHPAFRAANLLKVDIEGYDARALRGARGLLAAAAPAILFEHHPRLMAAAGEDPLAVFGELVALGYPRLVVYDNRGFLLGTLACDDAARAAELVSYARQQDGYYYDLVAFPARDAGACEAFLALERRHAADLER